LELQPLRLSDALGDSVNNDRVELFRTQQQPLITGIVLVQR
jgi:hypothetical protein